MDSPNFARSDQATISLSEMLTILRRGKWLIFCCAVVLMVVAGSTAWLIPNTYVAVTLLSPVTSSAGDGQLGSLGSAAAQLGGLASLAGISGSGDSKKSESIAILQSEALTEKFIQTNNLLPILYAKRWDATAKSWKEKNPQKVPTLWKAYQDFKKLRTAVNDTKTGLVTLTVAWKDPSLAAKWANDLVAMTNAELRAKSIAQSERNMAYLTDEAAKTSVVEVKLAVYKLLENEINKVMLARGSDEYAFRILDPAVPPEKPANLPVVAWLAIGFLGGFLLAIPIVLIKARTVRQIGTKY